MTQHIYNEVSYERITGRLPQTISFSTHDLKSLSGKRFLITGAGGSIGSRITMLIANLPNVDFLATDRDETALHSLSLELSSRALFDSPNIELLDIKDYEGVGLAIKRFRPDVIIHAAALKHLSALERQPREALMTNVFGTRNLIELAFLHKTPYFINISTDKAADATSVLGKSKRLTEFMIYDYRNFHNMSGWTSCRFGNVFNSRGSVIETFVSQIRNNSPITLTDENVSRYFMHRDEAAYLTLKSLLINAGDVHIFDMGEPVLIKKIIDNLISVFNSTSPIIITGLRPGEKLEEELYSRSEALEELTDQNITVAKIAIDSNEKIVVEQIWKNNVEAVLKYFS